MARIIIGGFQHETNTFAPSKAGLDAFTSPGSWPALVTGAPLFDAVRGINLSVAGFIEQARELGHDLVPTTWAAASPSAHVTNEAFEHIAGLILLGAAPCTAMVFVWSTLTKGDPTYTLVQVSINDLIMIIAFAPICGLLLGVTELSVPWETLLLSVLLYVVIPLGAGYMTRRALTAKAANHDAGEQVIHDFTARVKPVSVLGLLATVVLLFGFQGQTVLENPLTILLIAIPLILQSYGIFAIAYGWAKAWKVPFNVAAPCAMIGTSNFFELAVAVAISLFRSEEHTSELQSHHDLVCRLLLEKKKPNHNLYIP